MKNTLLIFQLISAAALIATILLHSAKGEGLGGIGGQAKLFGSQKGLEQGLDRLTMVFAIAFISISIILGIVGA
jgi:preprotein translocase subunit SecG